MSQVLTVPTHFNDIGELSEGFLDRVEQDTLILYGPVAYEEGSDIEFVLLLADGTTALEGAGRVRAAVDGGEDRVPDTRYDVVVEDLKFDGRSEVVFERLVIARQAVSYPPAAEEVAEDADVAVEAISLAPEDVYSLAPEDVEPDTVPPEEDDFEEDDEDPPTVIAPVDAEALMAEAIEQEESASVSVSDSAPEPEPASEPASEPALASASDSEPDPVAVWESEPVAEAATEPEPEPELERDDPAEAEWPTADVGIDAFLQTASETEIEIVGDGEPESDGAALRPVDSMYRFEHGIAEEPKVGMPVPMPSMAAPPEAPPAPPTLRLAEPPDGLTRPSLAQPEETLLSMEGEVSDVHTTGLFTYEDGLPIPAQPPFPDPNRAKQVASVEAANDVDVEESEPPELLTEEYEEVRLSDFAEAVEEG